MAETVHVGLVYGGRSPEHDVSINSARNVFRSLTAGGAHRVTPIRIDRDGRWHVETPGEAAFDADAEDAPSTEAASEGTPRTLLAPAEDGTEVLTLGDGPDALEALALDVVFPILHGPNGEDGRVQGLLDTIGLPYVGPNVLGSASCMDKEVAKRLLRDAGLPVVPFRVLRYGADVPPFEEVTEALGAALFVKPANAGSSVGTSKVEDETDYQPAIDRAFDFDNKVLIETAVDGREIECAALGNESPRVAGPGEVVSDAEFYTYEAKYDDEANASRMEVPADLPDDVIARTRALAERAFRVLGCEGLSRIDFFFVEGDDPDLFLNEVNTIPGFTARSMYPVMWNEAGLSDAELAAELVRLALARHDRDARLKMTL